MSLIADLLNFNLPKERFDTLNLFEKKVPKLASTILIPTPLVPVSENGSVFSGNTTSKPAKVRIMQWNWDESAPEANPETILF